MLNSHDCDCYYIIAVHCRVCCGPRARPRAYQVLCAVAAAPIGLGCFDNCCCCERRPPGVLCAAAMKGCFCEAPSREGLLRGDALSVPRTFAMSRPRERCRTSWKEAVSDVMRCPPPTPRRRQKRWMYAHAEPKKGLTCVHGTFTQNQRRALHAFIQKIRGFSKSMLVRITS